jgi:hypothetical protein
MSTLLLSGFAVVLGAHCASIAVGKVMALQDVGQAVVFRCGVLLGFVHVLSCYNVLAHAVSVALLVVVLPTLLRIRSVYWNSCPRSWQVQWLQPYRQLQHYWQHARQVQWHQLWQCCIQRSNDMSELLCQAPPVRILIDDAPQLLHLVSRVLNFLSGLDLVVR